MKSLYEQYQDIISESETKLLQINENLAEAIKNRDEIIGHMLESEEKYKADPSPENEENLSKWIELIRGYEDTIAEAKETADSAKKTIQDAKNMQQIILKQCSDSTTSVSIPEGASMPDKKSTRHSVSITLFCVAALFIISGFIESSNLVLLITISLSLLVAGLIVYSKETTSDLYEIQKTFQCISTRAAGVTFGNSDGRSRQGILKRASAAAGIANKCYVTAQLRHYLYKDEDAFAIETAYGCIGNIPADTVFRIVDAFDDIKTVLVYPKNFVNENGRTVWFADVEVYY